MVNLTFSIGKFRAKDKTAPVFKIIRLCTLVCFHKNDKLLFPRTGIVDTGAYFSLIPKNIWKEIDAKVISKDESIQGINLKPECAIPASLATVKCMLVDESCNSMKSLNIIAYLADSNKVPLLLGFASLLSEFEVVFNCKTNKAYIKKA